MKTAIVILSTLFLSTFGELAIAKPEKDATSADPISAARAILTKLAGQKDTSYKTQLAALNKLVDPAKGLELVIQYKSKHVKALPKDAASALYFSAKDTNCKKEKDGRIACSVHPGNLADGATYMFSVADNGSLTLVAVESYTEEGGGE